MAWGEVGHALVYGVVGAGKAPPRSPSRVVDTGPRLRLSTSTPGSRWRSARSLSAIDIKRSVSIFPGVFPRLRSRTGHRWRQVRCLHLRPVRPPPTPSPRTTIGIIPGERPFEGSLAGAVPMPARPADPGLTGVSRAARQRDEHISAVAALAPKPNNGFRTFSPNLAYMPDRAVILPSVGPDAIASGRRGVHSPQEAVR